MVRILSTRKLTLESADDFPKIILPWKRGRDSDVGLPMLFLLSRTYLIQITEQCDMIPGCWGATLPAYLKLITAQQSTELLLMYQAL